MTPSDRSAAVDCDIAIIGGGMVGLSLALLLARHAQALRIQVFDAHSHTPASPLYSPSFDARSTALASQSIDILRDIGLWQDLQQHATGIEQVHISDRGHFGHSVYQRKDHQGQLLGSVVDNAWFGRCLHDKVRTCPQIRVHAPVQVTGVYPRAGGARLRVQGAIAAEQQADASSVACTLAVIADGAHSALRSQLGIDVDICDYQQHAIVANVRLDQAHQGRAFERFTPHGPLALLPTGGSAQANTMALVWSTANDQLTQRLHCNERDFLAQLQHTFGYRLGNFLQVGQRHHYPLRRVLACEQVRSAIVLMGNAAHFLHPVAGQGFNLALRDAARLAKVLGQHPRRDELGKLSLLQRYVHAQQHDQWLTTELSHLFNQLFTGDSRAPQLLRQLGLVGLNLVPPLKQAFFRQMMGKGRR